jgi:hypothetical protein
LKPERYFLLWQGLEIRREVFLLQLRGFLSGFRPDFSSSPLSEVLECGFRDLTNPFTGLRDCNNTALASRQTGAYKERKTGIFLHPEPKSLEAKKSGKVLTSAHLPWISKSDGRPISWKLAADFTGAARIFAFQSSCLGFSGSSVLSCTNA